MEILANTVCSTRHSARLHYVAGLFRFRAVTHTSTPCGSWSCKPLPARLGRADCR